MRNRFTRARRHIQVFPHRCRRNFRSLNPYVQVVIASALAIPFLCLVLRLLGVEPREFPGWIQGIGSLLAIAFSLIFANRDAMERKKTDKIRAIYAAASLVGQVDHVLNQLKLAREIFNIHNMPEDFPQDVLTRSASRLVGLEWTNIELELLAQLPDKCALELAYCNSQIQRLMFQMSGAGLVGANLHMDKLRREAMDDLYIVCKTQSSQWRNTVIGHRNMAGRDVLFRRTATSMMSRGDKPVWDPWGNDNVFEKVKFWALKEKSAQT